MYLFFDQCSFRIIMLKKKKKEFMLLDNFKEVLHISH
jgi:hypothetical protein